MSPPSPRRSSRARPTTSQPPPSSSSSGNNSTSGRHERGLRTKAASPVKSEASVSKTLGDEDELSGKERAVPTTRRSNRRQIEELPDDLDEDEDAHSASMVDEDGETTRCVCGFQDYPGPPIDFTAAIGSAIGHTSRNSRHNITVTVTDVAEEGTEPGSLFIQCDICSVWQHGGCVGIISQSATPKDYFCEKCRPELHSLHKSPTGQRYSRYLPLSKPQKPHRKPSITKEWEIRGLRDAEKALKISESTKRRSTMNSRAAYDEDEVLRKVLEESKHENQSQDSRKGKRLRDDSEDIRSDVKRQRTHSSEPSDYGSVLEDHELTLEQLDELGRKRHTPRGAAAKNQREREMRDKERERAEAASKRKGRADRRRGDDAETPEERSKINDKSSMDEGNGSAPPEAISNKRSNGRAKRRVKGHDHDSPIPLKNGKDSPKDADEAASVAESTGTGANLASNSHNGHPRRGRAGTNGHREPTMSELKKRAALMLEFISQSKLEIERAETQGLGRSLAGSEAAGLGGDLVERLRKWQSEFTVDASGDVSSGP